MPLRRPLPALMNVQMSDDLCSCDLFIALHHNIVIQNVKWMKIIGLLRNQRNVIYDEKTRINYTIGMPLMIYNTRRSFALTKYNL